MSSTLPEPIPDNVTSLFGEDWEQQMQPPPTEGELWDLPVPLGQARALPTFPTAALPAWLAQMVAAVAEETQTPADLAGCLALATLSTAAGGRAVVNIRGRWREPVNIFTAVALDPGNRKSAVFALMTGPLLTAEKELQERSAAARAEAATSLRLAQAAADAAEKAAARAADDPDKRAMLTGQAIALTQEADAITVPAKPQLVADDITPENVVTLMAEQGGRISVLSPEGGIFEIIAGRYSGNPNMEVFLKGHAGDMVRVNRQQRDSVHLEQPAITMGLAIQPEVLESIARIKGADGRGLLARYLYALPESLVGRRRLDPDPIPDPVAEGYAARITGLTLALAGQPEAAQLTLSPEADAVLMAYQKVTESRLGKGGSFDSIVKWASKRDGAVARLAGLLHMAAHPEGGWMAPITGATMAAATELGDYFTTHALAVFDTMTADPAQDAARLLLAHLYANPLPTFTKRELFRAVARSDFPSMADLDPALALLEEHGWLRQQAPPRRTAKGGRPPSPRYQSHPCIGVPAD